MFDHPANTPPPNGEEGVASTLTPSYHERDASYVDVIVHVSPRIRIILDRNGIQYVVQRMFAETAHGEVWRGFSYHVTQQSLFKLCVKRQWLCEADVRGIITGLPETAAQFATQRPSGTE